jgi:hypothetical protein
MYLEFRILKKIIVIGEDVKVYCTFWKIRKLLSLPRVLIRWLYCVEAINTMIWEVLSIIVHIP